MRKVSLLFLFFIFSGKKCVVLKNVAVAKKIEFKKKQKEEEEEEESFGCLHNPLVAQTHPTGRVIQLELKMDSPVLISLSAFAPTVTESRICMVHDFPDAMLDN